MYEIMEQKQKFTGKWLRILMYTAIAGLANALLNYLPLIPAAVTTWISKGVSLVKIVCLLQLGSAVSRYRRTGILRAVAFVITLVSAFLYGSTVLILAALILSVVATYQEYQAHAELIEEQDAALAKRWRSLFGWSVAASFLLSVGSSIVTMIIVGQEIPAARISSITTAILKIPDFVIDVVYILSVRKMILLTEDPE